MSYLLCYRYQPWAMNYDPEAVWSLIQRHGGHIEQLRDSIDFYIHERWASLVTIAYPQLIRVPALDYIV